jgi:hypothetical protein
MDYLLNIRADDKLFMMASMDQHFDEERTKFQEK